MPPSRLLLQLAVVPVVAALVVLGVWVAGGLVTDDFRGSVALTTIWLILAGAICLFAALRSRTLRDRVVSERVVTGVEVEAAAPSVRESPAAAPKPKNVRLARGRFTSGEHATRGTATIVRLVNGRRYLTLTSFSTSPGPDLRVRLASSRTLDGGAADAVDLGALKGNRGDQQYRLPAGVNLHGRAVVIWCRAFSARFGSAALG